MEIESAEFNSLLRNGDTDCFEKLVREYGGKLLFVARRYLKNEADAQECVQEAYLQAFCKIHAFEGRSTLLSWLHRIVVNAALTKIRARTRRPEEFLNENILLVDSDGNRIESSAEIGQSVEDVMENEELTQLIRHYIDQLPDHARNLLLLRDIEGYSTQETADLLNISEAAVKTGLHRARTNLKDLLLPELSTEPLAEAVNA